MSSSRRQKIKRFVRGALGAALRGARNQGVDAAPPCDCEVTFVHADGTEDTASGIESGTTLLQAAKSAGVQLDSFCGGQCSCGTCRVKVVSGSEHLSSMRGPEEMTLGSSGIAKQQRLACQATVNGMVRVQIPRWF